MLRLLPALFINLANGQGGVGLNQFAGDLQLLFQGLARRIRIILLQGIERFLLIFRIKRLLPPCQQGRQEPSAPVLVFRLRYVIR